MEGWDGTRSAWGANLLDDVHAVALHLSERRETHAVEARVVHVVDEELCSARIRSPCLGEGHVPRLVAHLGGGRVDVMGGGRVDGMGGGRVGRVDVMGGGRVDVMGGGRVDVMGGGRWQL